MILCAHHITKIAILLSKFQSVNMGNFVHLIIIGLEGAWDVMEIHLNYKVLSSHMANLIIIGLGMSCEFLLIIKY